MSYIAPPDDQLVTVRRSTASDAAELARLAILDSGSAPLGPALVAEVSGRIVAAFPLDGGRAIADPFSPTAALLELLELRARQLEAARPRARLARLLRARPATG